MEEDTRSSVVDGEVVVVPKDVPLESTREPSVLEAEASPSVSRSDGTNSTQEMFGEKEEAPGARSTEEPLVPTLPVSNDVSDAELPVTDVTPPQAQAPEPAGEAAAATTLSESQSSEDLLPLILVSLPIDSLHCIASFLNTADWSSFGQSGRGTNRVCREIFRRVRLHGFRCATEVVAAWKLGRLADSRELAALYIRSGVPIYPSCMGHSYHTLVWRMGIEATEMDKILNAADEEENEEAEEPTRRYVDQFYSERYQNRVYNPSLTYLEEKCLFWYNQDSSLSGPSSNAADRSLSLTTRVNYAPPPPVLPANDAGVGGGGAAPNLLPGFRPQNVDSGILPPHGTVGLSLSTSYPDTKRPAKVPKLAMKVHSHLVDQHLLCSASVDDENGTMRTAPVSLSADFFHPHFARPNTHSSVAGDISAATLPQRSDNIAEAMTANVAVSSETVDTSVAAAAAPAAMGTLLDDIWDSESPPLVASLPPLMASDADLATVPATPPPERATPTQTNTPQADIWEAGLDSENTFATQEQDGGDESQFETPLQATIPDLAPFPPPPPLAASHQEEIVETLPPANRQENAILTNVDLQVYTSAAPDASTELKKNLRARFTVYQRKLDSLLVNLDNPGFEECLLDFWDEFFPTTCNIHFYDRYTAVPRLSKLQKFLTQPCPSALGIVQCEIERIRTSPKKKGVNMKGRLFPSYEYRLFIRDRRYSSSDDTNRDENVGPRRDSILMTAKNRGKKHMEISGVVRAPGSTRKGVNNYYLYMPQQGDVNAHFKDVNSEKHYREKSPNGAFDTCRPLSDDNLASGLLGRLQSNFIGTEFEIFAPTLKKQPAKKPTARPTGPSSGESENELDYDSGFSSDNPSTRSPSRRRGRFSRRSSSKQRRADSSVDHPDPIEEEEEVSLHSSEKKGKSLKRAGSWPVISYGRTTRTNRRAIAAHAVEPPDGQPYEMVLCEEEEGAITYTANLLGNRPRIMDVCLPKVTDDGSVGAEWKRYLDSCESSNDSSSGNRMLTRFKQLQQRAENPDNNNADDRADGEPDDGSYRPPDDFGLLALQNRPPWWNIELGAFVLNFGGRVNVASVKNFQLCDRTNQDYIMLQFGRIKGRHSFTMDFQHPLTAVQAFAIAISSLQSKISFG